MKLDGIMRLRIVVVALWTLFALGFMAVRFLEMTEARKTANYTIATIEPCTDDQLAQNYLLETCASIQNMIDDARISIIANSVDFQSFVLWTSIFVAVPILLFWAAGSTIGWIVRGFKQSSETT